MLMHVGFFNLASVKSLTIMRGIFIIVLLVFFIIMWNRSLCSKRAPRGTLPLGFSLDCFIRRPAAKRAEAPRNLFIFPQKSGLVLSYIFYCLQILSTSSGIQINKKMTNDIHNHKKNNQILKLRSKL